MFLILLLSLTLLLTPYGVNDFMWKLIPYTYKIFRYSLYFTENCPNFTESCLIFKIVLFLTENCLILKILNILIIPNILLIPYRSLLSPQQRYGNIPKILNILLIPIIPDSLLQKKLDINFNILKIPHRYGNIPKIPNILLIPIIPERLL